MIAARRVLDHGAPELVAAVVVVALTLVLAAGCTSGHASHEPALTLSASPRTVPVGHVITFVAESERATLAYLWSFSDERQTDAKVTGTGETTHVYASPGVRRVEVSAIAPDGARSHGSILIAVTEGGR